MRGAGAGVGAGTGARAFVTVKTDWRIEVKVDLESAFFSRELMKSDILTRRGPCFVPYNPNLNSDFNLNTYAFLISGVVAPLEISSTE